MSSSSALQDQTFHHTPDRVFVNGGAGNDTYIFHNSSQRYDWKAVNHGLEFKHKVSGNSVHLLNIETVKFSHDDVTLTFTCTLDTGLPGDGSEIHSTVGSYGVGGPII